MMTVTSIGYGDIVPSNSVEYASTVVFMLISGITWAQIVGQICGLAAAGNPVDKKYTDVTTNMNRMMSQMRIPPYLRQNVRLYMKHTKSAMYSRYRKESLELLSPTLIGQITENGRSFMLTCPPIWMNGMSVPCRSALFKTIQTESFSPKEEIISSARMNVLKKGTLAISSMGGKSGISIRLIMSSSPKVTWNEDFVLSQPELQERSIARTITYAEVDFLSKSYFEQVLNNFPEDRKKTRKRICWLAVFRMVQYMHSHEMMYPEDYNKKHSIPAAPRQDEGGRLKIAGPVGNDSGALASQISMLDSRMTKLESSNQQILDALTNLTKTVKAKKR